MALDGKERADCGLQYLQVGILALEDRVTCKIHFIYRNRNLILEVRFLVFEEKYSVCREMFPEYMWHD
jgi:hypothetical protein